MTHPEQDIDIDDLLKDLKATAEKATKLSAALSEQPVPSDDAGDRLIADVAKNLANLREATDLPPKSASQFEESIKQLRHEKLS